MRTVLSAAMTVNGFIDDLSPRRLKISSPRDWQQVKILRGMFDAILVGAGTVRCDNPSLVIDDLVLRRMRAKKGMAEDITKVTITGTGEIPHDSDFFRRGHGRKIVVTTAEDAVKLGASLEGLAEIHLLPPGVDGDLNMVTPEIIERVLSGAGISSLMVEGGSATLTNYLSNGRFDAFRLAVGSFLIDTGFEELEEAPRLTGVGKFRFPLPLAKVADAGGTAVMWYGEPAIAEEYGRWEDLYFMNLALGASRKCVPCDTAYCVGAVVRTASGEFFDGYTHETGPSNHAEEEAIAKALACGANLEGAAIYSTMEPCSTRASKPVSCSELIIGHKFSEVIYALAEPDCFVDCRGDELLRSHGIAVRMVGEIGEQVRELNRHILNKN